MKRQPTKSKKMGANQTSVKMLICKIYKELIQLKGQKKSNKPIKKWQEINKLKFFQEDI